MRRRPSFREWAPWRLSAFPRLLLSSVLVSAGGPRNEDDEDRHKSEQQEEKGWLVKKNKKVCECASQLYKGDPQKERKKCKKEEEKELDRVVKPIVCVQGE